MTARVRRGVTTVTTLVATLFAMLGAGVGPDPHGLGPRALDAQEWRTLESSRQLRSDAPATVRVEYAAGTIELGPTTDGMLYRMKLRYDAERSAPIAKFDATTRTVTLGTHSAPSAAWKSGTRDGSTLQAAVTTRVPLQLVLELGAVRADVQLGGLRLSDLDLKTGASELRLDVNSPNAESLGAFKLDAGAADVEVRRGGNLRARRVDANVGAGKLDYDLDGVWEGTTSFDATVALGALTLRVPSDVGLRVTAKSFLAGFKRAGLVKRGDSWYSPGYDDSARRADVRVTTVLGGFEVIRR